MKHRMNQFRENQKRKLTDLTIKSSANIKKLDDKVNQAEKILKLAEMNRKLETESEKILPFFITPAHEDNINSQVEELEQHLKEEVQEKTITRRWNN